MLQRKRNACWSLLALAAVSTILAQSAAGQATLDDPNASASDLANRLSGPGVTITNPSIPAVNGSDTPQQYGLFSNGQLGAGLAIDSGIVLATGTVADALGPNNDDNASLGGTTTYLDSDVGGIDPAARYNAAILTFDLTLDSFATGIEINYQFGSEEYPDYVGSRFNDVFAFFMSGSGIAGTENIAQAPLGGDVRINNINIGTVGCFDDATAQNLSQSAFYQNNGHITALPGSCQTGNALPGPFPVVTQYNGITTLLTARRTGLTPGETYQVKFALADVADQQWDSGVFIELVSATYDVDHGDAPASYGAPTHDISSALRLGAGVTGESSGYDDPAAAGDSDDAVTLPALTQGQAAMIPVSVTQAAANNGYLQGWIDWNGDGDFADPGEQIATDLQSATAGTSTINVPVTVPAAATTSQTFARFRWSTTAGLDATTAAPDGEVEDYQVNVQVPPGLAASCPAATGNYRPLDFSDYSGTNSAGVFSNVGFAADGTPLDFEVQILAGDTPQDLGHAGDFGKEAGDLFLRTPDLSAPSQVSEVTMMGRFVAAGTSTPIAIDTQLSLVDIDKKDFRRAERVTVQTAVETIAVETGTWLLVTEDGPVTFYGTENDASDSDTRSQFRVSLRNQSTILLTFRAEADPALSNPTSAGFSIDGDGTNVAFSNPYCGPFVADYSDAPPDGSAAPAGGSTAYGNAVHKVDPSVRLGGAVDEEQGPIGNADATGDGVDDDAVTTLPSLETGQADYSIPAAEISATGTGTLHAWLDFDGDGVFEVSEYASATVSGGAVQSDLSWTGQPTITSPGATFLRLRFADDGYVTASTPAGIASNGEVEDYQITVVTPIDLALSFDPPSGTPVIGFPYTVVVNLENESLIDATGVAVSFPLPAGWTYVSDDTGGNYDPATGLWTVGQSNAGVTETVEFTLLPLATGPYDLTAEVGAANENDADSTPGNGVPGEDDQAGLTLTPQLGTGTTIPAQTCSSGSVQTLDWDSATWAPGTRNASFSYAGISVDVDITDPQGALDGTPNGPMPVAGPFYQGGLAGVESTLIYETNDADLANGDMLTTISFGQAVDEVRLSLFDIDFSSLGPRLERVEIRGFNGASAVPVILDGGPAISINGAEAVGVDESDPTGAASGDGTVSIAFDQPVDRVEIDYGHAPGTNRSGNPGHPGFALHDISFCGGTALLTASKSVSVYTGSATNPDLYAIPGEDVIYAITVENTGTGPSDSDTIELIDLMPPQMAFYTGTTPEFGGTVIDWNETGTGLSFTPATDLAYSNSTSGAPADFSACTYTPVGSYDPTVTYICFNPKGAMAWGSEFTVSFRARIE